MTLVKKACFSFLICCILAYLIPIVHSQTAPGGCIKWNLQPIFEMDFPCVWNTDMVSTVLTDPNFAPLFKCRNVPTTATMGYTITPVNSSNVAPFSVSVWAENSIKTDLQIDHDLKSNFVKWANIPINLRSQEIPECLNHPSCLKPSAKIETLGGFNLGAKTGIFITTTYNTYIKNEWTNSGFNDMLIVETLIANCLTLNVNMHIK